MELRLKNRFDKKIIFIYIPLINWLERKMKFKKIYILIGIPFLFFNSVYASDFNDGVTFSCDTKKIINIEKRVDSLLKNLNIQKYVNKSVNYSSGNLEYKLSKVIEDPTKIYIDFKLKGENVRIPFEGGKNKTVNVPSISEIILAKMNPGRNFAYKGDFCSFDSFYDNIKIRQNTIAWISQIEWVWPDGDEAFLNKKYWHQDFKLKNNKPFTVALNDIFVNQKKYGFGCNFAAKMTMTQGLFDYYKRIKKDEKMVSLLEKRMARDGDYLEGIDPEYDAKKTDNNGKLLKVKYGIDKKNIVPGDWMYFENTDFKTKEKLGYEGSNSIYLGQNKFNDFYNDNNHSYSLEEKLDEVYQWRNEVFSRSRDAAKIQHLSHEYLMLLLKTPKDGGLLRDYRVTHYNFINKNGKLITDQ